MRKMYRPAYAVSIVGISAAALECVKLALAFAPNIEAVTLFCGIFGYVFGPLGVLSAIVFVTIEPLIYGFGSWVISYYLYWPFVAFVFMMLRKFKIYGRAVPTLTAVLLTVWFGVLTSLVEVGFFSGSYDNFFYRFGVYYMRGIPFYILQIASNAVLFPIAFVPLTKLLRKITS